MSIPLSLTVNGKAVTASVDPRMLLSVPDVELPAPVDLFTPDLAHKPRRRQ